jgi:hypothetical protein
MQPAHVAGEPLDTLVEALSHVEVQPARDGMTGYSMRLEPRLGTPLFRALMRVEAELLRDDADHFGDPERENRTYEQRAADAFVALTLRIGSALQGPDSDERRGR